MYGRFWETVESALERAESYAPKVRRMYDIIIGKRSPMAATAVQAAETVASKASSWLPWAMGGLLVLYLSKKKRR